MMPVMLVLHMTELVSVADLTYSATELHAIIVMNAPGLEPSTTSSGYCLSTIASFRIQYVHIAKRSAM